MIPRWLLSPSTDIAYNLLQGHKYQIKRNLKLPTKWKIIELNAQNVELSEGGRGDENDLESQIWSIAGLTFFYFYLGLFSELIELFQFIEWNVCSLVCIIYIVSICCTFVRKLNAAYGIFITYSSKLTGKKWSYSRICLYQHWKLPINLSSRAGICAKIRNTFSCEEYEKLGECYVGIGIDCKVRKKTSKAIFFIIDSRLLLLDTLGHWRWGMGMVVRQTSVGNNNRRNAFAQ